MTDGPMSLAHFGAPMAGSAALAAPEVEAALRVPPDLGAGAFFDVDNTILRGASMFQLARGLVARRLLSPRELARFAWKQAKFVIGGNESPADMAAITQEALAFAIGRSVSDFVTLGEEIFDKYLVDKLWPGTLALAQAHLDAGQRVWLVTATPVELAEVIARRLRLTGALGTVSEIQDGKYTGRLLGPAMHGLQKAEAVAELAERERLDLSRCAAYSDSANDIPLLTLVGHPRAVNPDSRLRSYAKEHGWPVHDYRRNRRGWRLTAPGAAGFAAGAGAALAVAKIHRGRS